MKLEIFSIWGKLAYARFMLKKVWYWVGGWMDGWMDGWKEGKAGLRFAYINQKLFIFQIIRHSFSQPKKSNIVIGNSTRPAGASNFFI